jgi:hypothetical protein
MKEVSPCNDQRRDYRIFMIMKEVSRWIETKF